MRIPACLSFLVLWLALLLEPCHSGLAPSLKARPSLVKGPDVDPEDVVRFTKNLYKDLGNSWNNTAAVADKYRPKFLELNQTTSGQLGQTLSSLLEIRMLDLQTSIRHARKMRSVFQSFSDTQRTSEAV